LRRCGGTGEMVNCRQKMAADAIKLERAERIVQEVVPHTIKLTSESRIKGYNSLSTKQSQSARGRTLGM